MERMKKMQAIQVENLSKSFVLSKKQQKMKKKQPRAMNGKDQAQNDRVDAVKNVSFNVDQGEIFGFLGPNGAGKTTTIRMLTGVLNPTGGKIVILGLDAKEKQIMVKQQIGNVPEMANVYYSLTGWENLMLIGELYGVRKNERTQKGADLLKMFSLYEKRGLKAKQYSKGMKQRLLLCMALMSEPKILFLDEPTSGLDVQSAKIIKKIIREYNKKGVTIFLTTHDMDVANELCDRIAIINHGKIISLDTPENLRRLSQEYQAIDLKTATPVELELIKSLRSVRKVNKTNGDREMHIIVEDINAAICEVVHLLESNNIEMKQLSTHQVKLEEAFLKIIEESGINE